MHARPSLIQQCVNGCDDPYLHKAVRFRDYLRTRSLYVNRLCVISSYSVNVACVIMNRALRVAKCFVLILEYGEQCDRGPITGRDGLPGSFTIGYM